jgi:signal transduction histidine kinase
VRADQLLIEVADNGHGFGSRQRHAGDDGIANMHDRLKSLGGICEIIGNKPAGTTVRFSAPLPRKFL